MAELISIARPYAKAAFQFASGQGQVDTWSRMLGSAAELAQNPDVQNCINDPRIGQEQLVELVVDICGESLDQNGRNFVAILAENHRLPLLAEIADLFDRLKQEAEAVVSVEVTTARPIESVQMTLLQNALEKNLNKSVSLSTQLDESLVGGAVIRYGDQVIDGSIRGRLAQLATALAQ
ncbi:MAG: F0F1 ATP synthase subunit delta [Gammaproteobacteria bacterium]|nr:F0F1 ATP synthase subunit delta [Gammaproteobacteria bacterium]